MQCTAASREKAPQGVTRRYFNKHVFARLSFFSVIFDAAVAIQLNVEFVLLVPFNDFVINTRFY